MNQEIKQQWVAALRSGEYIQGTGELKVDATEIRGAKHCCLGVLTEIYAKEHGLEFSENESPLKSMGGEYLCTPVIEWAGVDSENPAVMVNDTSYHLSVLNDEGDINSIAPYNFNQIADLIEEGL